MTDDQRPLDIQVASLWQEVISLQTRKQELERRIREHEDIFDTFIETPLWKRILFRIDGWPARRLVDKPKWRPWRRWWMS